MKVSETFEDLAIYPRNQVDDIWASMLAHKLKMGATLPPILVDKKTKKVVDGFHRRRAYIKVYGANCEIPVEQMSFKNDAEMFMESMRRNAQHGKPLSTVDVLMCVARGRDFGLDVEIIAKELNYEVNKLDAKAQVRIVTGPIGEHVILKRGMVSSSVDTLEEKKIIQQAAGKISFHAKSLYDLIRISRLDLVRDGVLQDLYNLRDLLNEKLPERVKEV